MCVEQSHPTSSKKKVYMIVLLCTCLNKVRSKYNLSKEYIKDAFSS